MQTIKQETNRQEMARGINLIKERYKKTKEIKITNKVVHFAVKKEKSPVNILTSTNSKVFTGPTEPGSMSDHK
jgi:hypothetical protein